MPYIKQQDRETFQELISNIRVLCPNAGDLNYIMTMLCRDFIRRNGENYKAHNAAIGVLECCKLEIYRRLTAPMEDLKIKENGDLA